jgi:hypothetical protein
MTPMTRSSAGRPESAWFAPERGANSSSNRSRAVDGLLLVGSAFVLDVAGRVSVAARPV